MTSTTVPAPSSQGTETTPSDGLLHFPTSSALVLEPHLPPPHPSPNSSNLNSNSNFNFDSKSKPFVTLTFATSLDSSLSLAPGVRTTLSGFQSKAMTHFLRSRHAAILVGVGTAVADDPGLNCKILSPFVSPEENEKGVRKQHPNQPRPIVLDPSARWEVNEKSKVIQLARLKQGLGPYIFVAREGSERIPEKRRRMVESVGGKFVCVKGLGEKVKGEGEGKTGFAWEDVLRTIKEEGLDSVMIEGGGSVINSLLTLEQGGEQELVDSVIVTIAPTWLGAGGVLVCPPRAIGKDGQTAPPVRLRDVSWHPLGEDVVLCGKILR